MRWKELQPLRDRNRIRYGAYQLGGSGGVFFDGESPKELGLAVSTGYPQRWINPWLEFSSLRKVWATHWLAQQHYRVPGTKSSNIWSAGLIPTASRRGSGLRASRARKTASFS